MALAKKDEMKRCNETDDDGKRKRTRGIRLQLCVWGHVGPAVAK